jgi:uncharacterized protein YkwD
MKLRFLRTTVLTALASAALAMPFLPTQAAGDMVNVTLTGEFKYDWAQGILRETNRYRTAAGLNPVVLDKQLTDAAMQRAAECNISFSHTRPNGKYCSSIFEDSFYITGENITRGAYGPEDATKAWYDSPGHRATLLSPSATSMGIGVFGDSCVQIMSRDSVIAKDTRNTKVKVSPIVESISDRIELGFEEPGEIIEKYNPKTSSVELKVEVASASNDLIRVDPKALSWTVADPSVARVDANGVVTELSEDRTTKVTAKLKADPSKSVTVDLGKIRDFNDFTTIEFAEHDGGRIKDFGYTGKPIKPEIKVIFNDGEYINMETGATWENKWQLKEGVDYTVSYKNNVKVGTATLTIHGKGKYFGSTSETFWIKDWGDYNPTGLKENAEIEFVIPIDYDGYRYTGEPLEPPVKVKFYDGEK